MAKGGVNGCLRNVRVCNSDLMIPGSQVYFDNVGAALDGVEQVIDVW